MSALLTALFLLDLAVVENKQPVNVSYVCKVLDSNGKQREFTAIFTVENENWTKLSHVKIADGDVVSKQTFDNSKSVLGRPAVKLQLKNNLDGDPKVTQDRLYQFDFTDDSFGYGFVIIKRFFDSNNNAQTPRQTEATGICTIVIPDIKQ